MNAFDPPISSSELIQQLRKLGLQKENKQKDLNTQDEKRNEGSNNDEHYVLSYQQQEKVDIEIEQANRIINEDVNFQLMEQRSQGNNQQTSNIISEQIDSCSINQQSKQLSHNQFEIHKFNEDQNFLLISFKNNQDPKFKKEILTTLLNILYGQSDFQIRLSNFDDYFYQQQQNITRNSTQLQINFQQEQIQSAYNNNSFSNNPKIEEEYIVRIDNQCENLVSQEMKWQILFQKCLQQFKQRAIKSNILIHPVVKNYQYKFMYDKSNNSQDTYNKVQKNFMKLKDELKLMVILKYQCENDDEASQISNLLNDQFMIRQLQQTFQTNSVVIDKLQSIKSYQTQKDEESLIFAIVYNYFEIPINQLQEQFNKMIKSEIFVKHSQHSEYLFVDYEPDLNQLHAQIEQIQTSDIQINLKVTYNDQMNAYQIQIDFRKLALGQNDDVAEQIYTLAQEIKNSLNMETFIDYNIEQRYVNVWKLYLQNQFRKQQILQVDDINQITLKLKGKRFQIENLKQSINKELSLLQYDQFICQFENQQFVEFLQEFPQIINFIEQFCLFKQKFKILHIGIIGMDNINICFEIIFYKNQDKIEIDKAIKSILVDYLNNVKINLSILLNNNQQLIQQFKVDYQILSQQKISEYSQVKSDLIINLIKKISQILNEITYRDILQFSTKQWRFLNKNCQQNINNIQQQFDCNIKRQADSAMGLDIACAIQNDKKIIIRYGRAVNQQCDLIVNPIYIKGKGFDISQNLISLGGEHYEEYLNQFLIYKNLNDNVYQTKSKQIKFILNLLIRNDQKNYLDRFQDHVQEIFQQAKFKTLQSIVIPTMELDFEVVQLIITKNIIKELQKSDTVKQVVLLRDDDQLIQKTLRVLQKLTYQQTDVFMYKDQDGSWVNYCPEINLKIHNLYNSKRDEKSNKFYVDFPITSSLEIHSVDLQTMSIYQKNKQEYFLQYNKDEKCYYHSKIDGTYSRGLYKRWVKSRELNEYIEFNKLIKNRFFEVCLKQLEINIQNNQISSPQAEISINQLNKDDHLMFQFLIKDPKKINEIIFQNKDLMKTIVKSNFIKIEVESKTKQNLLLSKQSLNQLLFQNYLKVKLTICKLSQNLQQIVQDMIQKYSIEYDGQVRQGCTILITGFRKKLQKLSKKLEIEGIQVQLTQLDLKDKQ